MPRGAADRKAAAAATADESCGPTWLRIDPATGLLSGTPDAPGKVEAVATAGIDREVPKRDDAILK